MSKAWRQPSFHRGSCPDGNCVGSEQGGMRRDHGAAEGDGWLWDSNQSPGGSGLKGKRHKDT